MTFASEQDIWDLIEKGQPLLDVRAPVEFAAGSLPGAINIPLLDNEERVLVGTTYKKQGNKAAIDLGETLVSGSIKTTRIESWLQFFKKNPNSFLYCFRGGQRSQYVQKWLSELGCNILRIDGGYKKWRYELTQKRNLLIEQLNWVLLAGQTGSGKSQILQDLISLDFPAIDIELLAHHRGSAFGALPGKQPSVANFENSLTVKLLELQNHSCVVVEDESKSVGALYLPDLLWKKMRQAPLFVIEESMQTRVQHIYIEYVQTPLEQGTSLLELHDQLQTSLFKIKKRLGGCYYTEIEQLLRFAFTNPEKPRQEDHTRWIQSLLVYYYDPLYKKSLQARSHQIVFQGSKDQITHELKNYLTRKKFSDSLVRP